MKKLMQIMLIGVILAASAIPIMAQDPTTPPFLYPQEKWTLTYDDYHRLLWDNNPPKEYLNLSRQVSIVRDGDELYIQGIFKEYPDAWIICTDTGTDLQIDKTQILATDSDGNPVYFHWGAACYEFWSGITFQSIEIVFSTSDLDRVSFTTSGDGATMTATQGTKYAGSFWFEKDNEAYVRFDWGYYKYSDIDDVEKGTGFPDVGYMVNMVFHQINDSGIENIMDGSIDDTTKPMYDLQGRMVNPETASPGLYIRNGRKILIH